MTRRSTPRPTYATPTLVRAADAPRHRWGDEVAGYVDDEVLLSTDKLHGLVFTLPPGGRFGHSPENRTIFAADEVYYLLEGTFLLANPATGEIQRANVGDAAFFRRDTWHHGMNHGLGSVRVLEFFAPPPAMGTSSAYAALQPYLADPRYVDDALLGRWPDPGDEAFTPATIRIVRPNDHRLRVEGGMLVGLVASTEELTVAVAELLPGRSGPLRGHAGDACLYVTDGVVNVHVPEAEGPDWFEVGTGDAFVVPAGFEYQPVNQRECLARFVLGAAPTYRAVAEASEWHR